MLAGPCEWVQQAGASRGPLARQSRPTGPRVLRTSRRARPFSVGHAGPVEPEHAVDPDYFEARMSGLERDLIERALAESGGKIREASRRLGLARNTLKAKMAKYGLRGHDSGPD